MLEFWQQLTSGLIIIPSYIILISIILVILPTIIAFILRYFLYSHLHLLNIKVRRLLREDRQGQQPRIINNLEERVELASHNIPQLNTGALIEGVYSQEKFPLWGFLSLKCETIDFFSRNLPNLLLSFGLLGTFLGITINLASLSQTISQVDINDVRSLVEELDQPLQAMGIAFITSLIAVSCSAFLTVINLIWNTSIAKSSLINSLEDYLDNIYLPRLPTPNPLKDGVEILVSEFSNFLDRFGQNISQIIVSSVGDPVQQIVRENQKISELTKEVYRGLVDASDTFDNSAVSLQKAATTIEQSRFPEKLTSATADLAIAQNQFSQSSLILNKSTQTIETTLEVLQKSLNRMTEIGEKISTLNEKNISIISAAQKRNVIEEASLNEIKYELANLVDKIRKMK